MKYVLFYESADDFMEKIPQYFAAHRARWQQFVNDGSLVGVGPFEDPRMGSMGIFTTREAAEAFATEDPFVINGVVSRWHVRGWSDALAAT